MSAYQIPAKFIRTEIIVLNSRFIASTAPAFSVKEARQFISRMKEEFQDASHNVPAFIIGHGASLTEHCSDDREPSGTAGRPVLAVLRGSGLGDIVLVVTRYFGGKKLGTGGLVRAYTDSAKAVLQILPRAERVPIHTVLIVTPYPAYNTVCKVIKAHNGHLIAKDFQVDATLTAQITVRDFEAFQNNLTESTHGRVEALIINSSKEIIPLNSGLKQP